ncbi:hypothetical protein TRIUR3_14083 [Triticum urartu]|uniref:DNA-repair protein Xrcc1 N-terminal domain-containing protein n=1 Tax=Triticum urartu TaxID=4572 RepID=M7ZTJ8_TRIUA|nr:hypothetical protein TRIUR3_14083 [Triticum urartu]
MEAAPEREREGRGEEWSDGGVALGFRVKACSRESSGQKAANVLEPDLRSHWSTATNTKEWILLELNEPCLVSHIRIYNKSVLEWEACSRESSGQKAANVLEPDLRSHWSTATNTKEWILLELNEPCLVSHIRIYNKSVLEWEVTGGLRYKPEAFVKVRPRGEAPKRDMVYPANHTPCRYVRISCLRGSPIAIYFIQLTGIPVPGLEPEFQPLVNHLLPQISSSQKQSHSSHNMHLQLLKDIASRLPPFLPQIEADLNSITDTPESSVRFLALLAGPFYPILNLINERDATKTSISSADSDTLKTSLASIPTVSSNFEASKYSFRILLFILLYNFGYVLSLCATAQPRRARSPSSVQPASCMLAFRSETAILLLRKAHKDKTLSIVCHRPQLGCKLAETTSDMWSVLPLVQALLPALRPPFSAGPTEQIDDCFSQWNHPDVHNALSQVDLAVELLEDLLGVIQGVGQSLSRSRAALKYILLAISGNMDDVLAEYKEVKHKILFILEMLDPFVDHAISAMKDRISFGGVSAMYLEKQAKVCHMALNIIRTAAKNPAVLPSLELEWRRGAVAPSILLSILDPHMPLPPDVDICKSSLPEVDQAALAVSDCPAPHSCNPEVVDGRDTSEIAMRIESFEQCNSLFAPEELKQSELTNTLREDHDKEPTIEGHNAGIDALLLAAECYVNPFFLLDLRLNSEPLDRIERTHSELIQRNASFELKDLLVKDLDLATVHSLENKRDRAVLDLLLQAAKFDCEYQAKIPDGEVYPNDAEDDKQAIEISPEVTDLVDAVTLVRKNQALLWHFIMKQFGRKGHLANEILLDSLLFLLHSATDLFCPPDNVIDIILNSAENLNRQLACLYSSVNAGDKKLDNVKLHGLQRRWALLQKLVLASSGSDNTRELVSIKKDGFRFRSLVPPSAWVHKISEFSRFSSPLPRFLGWMAVSRYAKEYLNERLFLASDFSQLTTLLSIFTDELSLMDGVATQKVKSADTEQSACNNYLLLKKESMSSDKPSMNKLFQILLPELHFFFPSMSRLFHAFGETILEAVGLQLKCLPKSAVQDVLCWFSEMCMWPYLEGIKEHLVLANGVSSLRGNIAANAKAVVFYLLESVVSEHLEAIVPEMPRVVHILVSLCRASYADVAFLDSVLCLLKPLISYFLRKGTDDEQVMGHITDCSDFELICFEELFEIIRCGKHTKDPTSDKIQVPLLIFILGSLLPDLSFKRRIEILDSLLVWVDSISSDPPSLLCSYLEGFHTLIDGCVTILVQNIELLGIIILSVREQSREAANSISGDAMMQLEKNSQDSAEQLLVKSTDNAEKSKGPPAGCIIEFCDALEKVISHLTLSIESSWKWHHQLASRLSSLMAKCLLYAKCLKAVTQGNTISSSTRQEVELVQKHWESALEGLAETILGNQEKQCWQVASSMLDYMIKLPNVLAWGNVLSATCSAIEHFCSHAPRISWRLQTEKWLLLLVSGGIEDLKNSETSLINLFCTMLSHAEPEQRSVALQQLGRIIHFASTAEVGSGSAMTSHLVTHTWNRIAALALYDSSMLLRNHAMALLTEYVPFVDKNHLRSFLASSDSILKGVGQLSCVIEEGYLTRMSLLLLSKACLYSSSEDIALIPECVWRKLENMQTSLTGGFGDVEKDLCRALCQLRTESDKTVVKELLAGSTTKPVNTDYKDIRESILQSIVTSVSALLLKSMPSITVSVLNSTEVLSSLSSVESYFEFFSIRSDQECQELEEAEIELELIKNEKAVQKFVGRPQDTVAPDYKDSSEVNKQLQQIREDIRSLERSKLREEIIARRQKKLLIRHTREKYLEETSCKEMELMQELDRERTLEMERDIERQRQLDLERVKSRELQYNLDMEREKQTQRELQRELEQVELGRSSRREFSSNPSSRARERYRERDNGRGAQQEGSRGQGHEGQSTVVMGGASRPSSFPTILQSRDRGSDGGYEENAEGSRDSGGDTSSMGDPELDGPGSTVVMGGASRPSSFPTILQSRDRGSDGGYEENAEGSRDSGGDTSSMGDPELDGPGSGSRHGTRAGGSSKSSRQVLERRERDGRREGKWERKQ